MSTRSLRSAQQLLAHAGWEAVTCRVHDLLGPPGQEAAPWRPSARSTEQSLSKGARSDQPWPVLHTKASSDDDRTF